MQSYAKICKAKQNYANESKAMQSDAKQEAMQRYAKLGGPSTQPKLSYAKQSRVKQSKVKLKQSQEKRSKVA
jgi:hypothetical protein